MNAENKYLEGPKNKVRQVNISEEGWSYYLNSLGYRDIKGQEWTPDDINSSILFIGCSQTFGSHLDIKDSAPYRLQQQTGIKTLNLGATGGSLEYMLVTTIKFLEKHRPLAIVYNYTTPERYLDWESHTSTSPLWSKKHNDMEKFIIKNEKQINEKAKMIRRNIKLLCENKTEYIELTWNHWWESNGLYKIKKLDHAVDGQHWGPQTNQFALDSYIIPMLELKEILR